MRQRVRPIQLPQRLDAARIAAAEQRGGPLAALVDREQRRALEGRAPEGGHGEGALVLLELHALEGQLEFGSDAVAHPQSVTEPQEHAVREAARRTREAAQRAGEHALELAQRLAREDDGVQFVRAQARAPQALARRAPGEGRVVAAAREPRLARAGDRATRAHQHGRRVALEGGEAEDVHAA
jgi:hypothetical protein